MHRTLCVDHKIKEAKKELYALLLHLPIDSYLAGEIDILFQLSIDDQIQQLIDEHLPKV